jgi:hypothetical protein
VHALIDVIFRLNARQKFARTTAERLAAAAAPAVFVPIDTPALLEAALNKLPAPLVGSVRAVFDGLDKEVSPLDVDFLAEGLGRLRLQTRGQRHQWQADGDEMESVHSIASCLIASNTEE